MHFGDLLMSFFATHRRLMNLGCSDPGKDRRRRWRTRSRLRQCAGGLVVAVAVILLPMSASAQVGGGGLSPLVKWHIDRLRDRLRHRAFRADWRRLRRLYPARGDRVFIVVDIATQKLYLFLNGRFRRAWTVSTSRYGVGRLEGSMRTPTGVFRVTGVVGQGAKPDAVLGDAGPTGRFADPVTAMGDIAASDLILGRILDLEGLQPGWNEGGDVDTAQRDIYIHGTANVGMLGEPASEGCVQMAPRAVIRLARLMPSGALVMITPGRGNLRKIPGPLPLRKQSTEQPASTD